MTTQKAESNALDYEARHPWLERLFRPWMVALMAACLALAAAEMLTLFYPPTVPAFFVISAALGALVGHATYRLGVAAIPSASDRRTLQLLVLAVAFVVIKALSFAVEAFSAVSVDVGGGGSGIAGLLVETWLFFVAWSAELVQVVTGHLTAWARNPLAFFDATTLAGFAFFWLAWGAAVATAKDFARIGVPTEDRQERPPLQAITQRFLVGGVALLVFASMARTDLWYPSVVTRPPLATLIVSVLLYSALGFLSVAQTHLLTRVRRWQQERATLADDLAQRWLVTSVVFLVGVAAVSAVLPTGFTAPLLEWGRWVLWAVMMIGTFIFFLLNLLLWAVMQLFSWFLGSEPPLAPSFEPEAPPPPMGAVAGGGGDAPEMLALRTVAVLALALGGLALLFQRYLREHPEVRARLELRRLPLRWRRWLAWLLEWAKRSLRRARLQLQKAMGLKRAGGAESRSMGRATRGRKPETARELVVAVYHGTLGIAADAGVPRRGNQTPDEYAEVLADHLPAARDAVGGLTDGFDVARYSSHELTAEDAERARRHAGTIAGLLEGETGTETDTAE